MRGLLGKKLGHSFSKQIHEKLDGTKYDLIEVADLDSFFQENSFSGLNVTIPYKSNVIKYLDKLEGVASKIRIVNTIINEDGALIGYNTDYAGFEFMLNHFNINPKGKTIGILGNGATMKTLKFYFKTKYAKNIYVFARNPKDNEYYFNNNVLKTVDILVNATPNGMFPNNHDPLLVDLQTIPHLECVIDLIYNPIRSNLLIEAERLNIKAVNGLLMLISQAVYANELFNNTTYNPELITSIYKEILLDSINIAIIGPPMSGKTFMSKQIAKHLNKTYIDIDSIIEQQTNKSIPDIFKENGETMFRLLENRAVLDYSKRYSQAISPGGGVILNYDNIQALKQNGIIIFLDVHLDDLLRRNPKDRPLLQNKTNLISLYNNRIGLYNNYCDIKIRKQGFNEKKTLKEIEVKIHEYIGT